MNETEYPRSLPRDISEHKWTKEDVRVEVERPYFSKLNVLQTTGDQST